MIVLQRNEYKSIAEAARKHDLSYNTLLHRIKKHGKEYKSIADAARQQYRDFIYKERI